MEEKWFDTYNKEWVIYDRFSACEDHDDNAFNMLLKHIDFQGKTVYEMGCGTGKYTEKISTLCDKLYTVDISPLMVEKTRVRCSDKNNIEYIINSAENSNLPDESVDIIFAAWAHPPYFDNFVLIENIEKEFSRILKKGGSVWLLNNYLKGEFTQMRGFSEPVDPAAYFLDIFSKYDYTLAEIVPAYWKFKDMDEAKTVCSFIFGDNAIRFFEKKGSPTMDDNIGIFTRTK